MRLRHPARALCAVASPAGFLHLLRRARRNYPSRILKIPGSVYQQRSIFSPADTAPVTPEETLLSSIQPLQPSLVHVSALKLTIMPAW